MKCVSKFMTGAAAAALITVSTATPAMARDWDNHHGGISTGEAIAGIAIIGGAAAIATALTRDNHRYGNDYRYRYQGGYNAAVSSCGYEADRYGRGRVRITDVDRRSYDRYRVRGVIEGGYGRYDSGWGGGYDRYDRYDNDYRYDGGYGRGSYGVAFTCTARSDGRITDFRTDRGNRW
jgi:hypothetical protein